jgi:hypothetical protein
VTLGNLGALLVRVFFPFLLFDILCSFIQGARPSKRKTGEDNTNNSKIDRKRKRARNQAGPPPGTQIVNLDPDLPAGPTSTHPTITATTILPQGTLSPPAESTREDPQALTRPETAYLSTTGTPPALTPTVSVPPSPTAAAQPILAPPVSMPLSPGCPAQLVSAPSAPVSLLTTSLYPNAASESEVPTITSETSESPSSTVPSLICALTFSKVNVTQLTLTFVIQHPYPTNQVSHRVAQHNRLPVPWLLRI